MSPPVGLSGSLSVAPYLSVHLSVSLMPGPNLNRKSEKIQV